MADGPLGTTGRTDRRWQRMDRRKAFGRVDNGGLDRRQFRNTGTMTQQTKQREFAQRKRVEILSRWRTKDSGRLQSTMEDSDAADESRGKEKRHYEIVGRNRFVVFGIVSYRND